jgi:ribonuclease HIII
VTNTTETATVERIGIDESGKGDYFGPLVIAAVFVDATTQGELRLMNVRDSKKISDGRILEMAPDIRTICPHSIIAIGPQRYNELYAKIRNLNRLLAWGHAKALETLLERVSCGRAIADQFGDERLILNALQEKGRTIVLEQKHKAESDRLSDEIGTTLPKGASPAVELAGRMIVKKHGEERLGSVAKLHFKTTQAVLGTMG